MTEEYVITEEDNAQVRKQKRKDILAKVLAPSTNLRGKAAQVGKKSYGISSHAIMAGAVVAKREGVKRKSEIEEAIVVKKAEAKYIRKQLRNLRNAKKGGISDVQSQRM